MITKLSKLKERMSIDDVIDIFGKEPFVVKETGMDIFVYHSGDIEITLTGASLWMVTVRYNDCVFSIDLNGLDDMLYSTQQ